MPELPEVETTRRGIAPHITGQAVTAVDVRNSRLRWPIPPNLAQLLEGQSIIDVGRRGKYLLLKTATGTLLLHLGMSGSLRITPPGTELRKHDHLILRFDNQLELRLHDPRRFGAALWTAEEVSNHPLIASLGPEPLEEAFTADYLYARCQGRKTSIKQHIMNSHVVVGVGNIYASESLFLSGIQPKRPANKISAARISKLRDAIIFVLHRSITQGGTTLRDFVREDGQPGYFKQQLTVYGRENQPCVECGGLIKNITLGQRSTYYCPKCQT